MEEHSERKNIKINEGRHSSERERQRERDREMEGEERDGGRGGQRDDTVRRECVESRR